MTQERIRPLAICVFRQGNRILAAEGYDPIKDARFYRPLGGAIEFGEYGHQTIVREIQEEIGEDVTDLHYLGALENIFTFNGQPGHEIVLVYDGAFVDSSVYQRSSLQGQEDNEDLDFTAIWISLDDIDPKRTPLYPDGLWELLTQEETG